MFPVKNNILLTSGLKTSIYVCRQSKNFAFCLAYYRNQCRQLKLKNL
jgi:hypothetical protein